MALRYSIRPHKVDSIRGKYTEYSIYDSKYRCDYGGATPSRPEAERLCNWLNNDDARVKAEEKENLKQGLEKVGESI